MTHMGVSITDRRRDDLLDEISKMIKTDRLASGQAGKLNGKLHFVSSQFLGRCGRAALRALSERQYSPGTDSRLTMKDGTPTPVKKVFILWESILRNGRPRPIPARVGGPADAILSTDGFYPDERRGETGQPRIGGVLCARWRKKISSFTKAVPEEVTQRWWPRKTQIVQVELLAIVAACQAYGPELEGKRVIVLVDSESVLGAAIKGYSSKEDISDAVTELWTTISKYGIVVYFDRVSTDANISDGPSRYQLEMARKLGWDEHSIELS